MDGIPESILIIPFILNIAPIVWVSGKKFKIDKNLAEALISLKKALFHWQDIQKNIDKSRNSELMPDYISWLHAFDFDRYYAKVSRKTKLNNTVKNTIKSIPGVYKVFIKFKEFRA